MVFRFEMRVRNERSEMIDSEFGRWIAGLKVRFRIVVRLKIQ